MISNKTYETLLNWQPVSNRIISARFSSKVRNISTIQCYAPTELAVDNEKDEFYCRLNAVFTVCCGVRGRALASHTDVRGFEPQCGSRLSSLTC